jgi:hypothetical protein
MHLVMRLFYYDACNLAFVDASIFLLLRLYNSFLRLHISFLRLHISFLRLHISSIQLPATQAAGRAGKHSSSTVKEGTTLAWEWFQSAVPRD